MKRSILATAIASAMIVPNLEVHTKDINNIALASIRGRDEAWKGKGKKKKVIK